MCTCRCVVLRGSCNKLVVVIIVCVKGPNSNPHEFSRCADDFVPYTSDEYSARDYALPLSGETFPSRIGTLQAEARDDCVVE
jgi:hypothetical protein